MADMPSKPAESILGDDLLRLKVLELEDRLSELETIADHHQQEHHLAFDALSDQLWSSLGETNGEGNEEEYMLGGGI